MIVMKQNEMGGRINKNGNDVRNLRFIRFVRIRGEMYASFIKYNKMMFTSSLHPHQQQQQYHHLSFI